MKLVEFENGEFGIRVYWFFGWYFRDLESNKNYSWRREDSYFQDCQGSREKAEEYMNKKPIDALKPMKYKIWRPILKKTVAKNLTGGEYKTITIKPGTKMFFSNVMWDDVRMSERGAKEDENGFEYTHTMTSGIYVIKLEDITEEEHQKENVIQNPTGKRMIQL